MDFNSTSPRAVIVSRVSTVPRACGAYQPCSCVVRATSRERRRPGAGASRASSLRVSRPPRRAARLIDRDRPSGACCGMAAPGSSWRGSAWCERSLRARSGPIWVPRVRAVRGLLESTRGSPSVECVSRRCCRGPRSSRSPRPRRGPAACARALSGRRPAASGEREPGARALSSFRARRARYTGSGRRRCAARHTSSVLIACSSPQASASSTSSSDDSGGGLARRHRRFEHHRGVERSRELPAVAQRDRRGLG